MNLGFAGCSHSTNDYGKCWAYYMLQDLQPTDYVDVSISGASNEFLIEKIKKALEMYKNTDFYIIQLTDPSRMLFGLSGNDPVDEYLNIVKIREYNPTILNCHRTTNGVSYFNFLNNSDDGDLNRILNKNYSIANIIQEHFLISDYNMKIKIFHTLMSLKTLFDSHNVKVIFFSWFVDIKKLSKEMGYENILKNFIIKDGCVLDFIQQNNLEPISKDNLHYGTNEHKMIYDQYLRDFILENIK